MLFFILVHMLWHNKEIYFMKRTGGEKKEELVECTDEMENVTEKKSLRR